MSTPILLMSSERSGSNLLRSILNAHNNVSSPVSPHLLKSLSKAGYKRRTPLPRKVIDGLIEDCLEIVNIPDNRFSWNINIKKSEILKNLETPTFEGVILTVYELHAKKKGCDNYVLKENALYHHASNIKNQIKQTKVIYLVRDGRDVAASEKKIPTKNRHIYLLADNWKKEQDKSLEELSSIPKNDHIKVKYEELVTKPIEVIKNICEVLEIPFSQKMLEFYKIENARKDSSKAEVWKNLSSPIKKQNFKKYQSDLTSREIRIFEKTAGKTLKKLGYSCDTDEFLKKISPSEDILYRAYNKFYTFWNKKNKQYTQEEKEFLMRKKKIIKKRRALLT